MSRGAFLLSRSIFESEIRFKPPEYIKLWIYMLGKANHKPKKYAGYMVDRGQCFITYKELNEQLKYKIGFRNKVYHESFVKDYMKRLRSTLMVTSVKQPRGVLVTILEYCKYQDMGNYETTSEATNEATNGPPVNNQGTPSINKNDKNEKNERKKEEGFDIFKISDLYQLVEDQFSHISDLSEEDKYTLADGLLKRAKHMKGLNGSFTDSQMDALVFTLKELKEQSVKFIMRSIMNSIQSGYKRIYPAYKVKEEVELTPPSLDDEEARFKIFDDMLESDLSKKDYLAKLGVDPGDIMKMYDRWVYKDLDLKNVE